MTGINEAHGAVVAKAHSDPEFRARLLAEPRAAVAEVLGVDLPEGVTITVVEQAPAEAVIVLPAAVADGAVADEELAAAVGGWHPTPQCTEACRPF